MGHTPGSWKVVEAPAYDGYGNPIPYYAVMAGERTIVDNGYGSKEDAHMISAAPNMFRCLLVACDWLADKGVPADHIEMVRIREALAKAVPREGEA